MEKKKNINSKIRLFHYRKENADKGGGKDVMAGNKGKSEDSDFIAVS